ncbi:MAG: DUF4296 domain-containing protein, partial [Bacteroidota bacterium]|nr:DUF4296 domain-containing protein [Bacteroidota bacterium]
RQVLLSRPDHPLMNSIKDILTKVLLLGLSVLVLTACRQEEGKVLSQKKMAAVLTDIYLTEAVLQNVDRKKKTEWSRGLEDVFFQDLAYGRVLEKHRITEEVFYNSVAHYSQQYKVYAKIYEQVELNLQAIRDEVDRRDKLETKLRELAQQQAALVEALDTASYIKWFEIWALDTIVLSDTLGLQADSVVLSDTLGLQTDSAVLLDTLVSQTGDVLLSPLNDSILYTISFWPKPVVRDRNEWTMADFTPGMESGKVLREDRNPVTVDLKRTIREVKN